MGRREDEKPRTKYVKVYRISLPFCYFILVSSSSSTGERKERLLRIIRSWRTNGRALTVNFGEVTIVTGSGT